MRAEEWDGRCDDHRGGGVRTGCEPLFVRYCLKQALKPALQPSEPENSSGPPSDSIPTVMRCHLLI